MNEEEKDAVEYLDKYTKWETFGERNLEKDIITVLSLLKKLQEENKYIHNELNKQQATINKYAKENEELKNKLSLKQFDINVVYNDYLEKLNEYEENSISIQKVKDKIEEIEEKMKYEYNKKILVQLYKQRKVLKELLEEEKVKC